VSYILQVEYKYGCCQEYVVFISPPTVNLSPYKGHLMLDTVGIKLDFTEKKHKYQHVDGEGVM